MKLGKPPMNYRNDFNECLTYFRLLFKSVQFENINLWVA